MPRIVGVGGPGTTLFREVVERESDVHCGLCGGVAVARKQSLPPVAAAADPDTSSRVVGLCLNVRRRRLWKDSLEEFW